MVQLGLNAGPRHARISAWAASYARKLLISEMVTHDKDVIAAVTLVWSIAQYALPSEITDEITRKLEEEELPRIALRNVSEGDQTFHTS